MILVVWNNYKATPHEEKYPLLWHGTTTPR